MYSQEELEIINLADSFTLLYSFLGQALLEQFGLEGERALREGTRRFGRDRGETLRKKHLGANVKVNMLSLFTVGPDLPPDPRYKKERISLNPQERVSRTDYCPMADLWKEYGAQDIGRIYCEEFHSACYGHYAYGYTKVNLAKTLTQPEDQWCAFNVFLRPENLPEELKPVCFAEYDPGYSGPDRELPGAYGKSGFATLFLKLYAHIAAAALDQLGEPGMQAVCQGLERMAQDGAQRLRKAAQEQHEPLTLEFFARNYPLEADPDREPMWEEYGTNGRKETMVRHFYGPLFQDLGLVPCTC